ncbi:hypothetical protein BJ742DRAFT_784317 [Cladochytrium replicatum]|nr:hypothetical protein BJ742DRAFT_784317 [Cladochytrium replicatum]
MEQQGAATLLEPVGLTQTPFSGSIYTSSPEKQTKKSRASNATQKSLATAITITPARNLADLVPVTVQGEGIYLYDVSKQECLRSWTVPPKSVFASSAVFVPLSASENDDDFMAVDGSPDRSRKSVQGRLFAIMEKVAEAPGAMARATVCAWPFEPSSKDGESKSSGKPVATIEFGKPMHSLFVSLLASHPGVVAIHSDASLKVLDTSLSTLFESDTRSTDNFDVIWCKAFEGKFSFHTTPKTEDGYMHIVTVLRERENLVLRVSDIGGGEVIQFKTVYEVTSTSLQSKEGTQYNFVFQHEPARLVAFGTDGILKVLHLESGSLKSSIQFSVASLGYQTESDSTEELGHSITICAVDSFYISILGSNATDDADIVSMWDTKFGTLQCHKSFQRKESRGARKVYGLDVTSSTANGPILLVTNTTLPRDKARALAFKSSIQLLPFYCPPLTMMSALGKVRDIGYNNILSALGDKPEPAVFTSTVGHDLVFPRTPLELEGSRDSSQKVKGVLKNLMNNGKPIEVLDDSLDGIKLDVSELSTVDSFYVSKLLESGIKEDAFELLFTQWMNVKMGLMDAHGGAYVRGTTKKKYKKLHGGRVGEPLLALSEVPAIELSQPVLSLITRKSFSDPKRFWPSKVLEYLLRSQLIASSRFAVNASSLIQMILVRGDLSLLYLAMKNVAEMDEAELVDVIRYFSFSAEPFSQPEDGAASSESTAAVLRWPNPETRRKRFEEVTGESTIVSDLFLSIVFGRRRNDMLMTRAMRRGLGIMEIQFLLEWSLHIFNSLEDSMEDDAAPLSDVNADLSAALEGIRAAQRGASSALWWVWSTEPNAESIPDLRRDLFSAAVDLTTMLIDSHLPTILLTPAIHPVVISLSEHIHSEAKELTGLQRGWASPMALFDTDKSARDAKSKDEDIKSAKKQKPSTEKVLERRQWKKMVSNLTDGVGQYAVEVFTI